MNGPSMAWLANVGAGMSAMPAPPPNSSQVQPGPPPPPPEMAEPPPREMQTFERSGDPGMSAPEPNMSVMPPVDPAASPAPTQPGHEVPHVTIPRNEFRLQSSGGGGVIPEHEKDMRAPTLKKAQDMRNVLAGATIDQVGNRNVDMAQQEYGMALDHERQARAREAAAQASIVERDEELAQRQADFDGTVKQLSKMGQIDRGRVYASMSTPQKIAGFVELALAGFNRAPSMILKKIDDDVKAQEFAYAATRDTAQAKQSAFSMAMQKYQNVDVARAAARAAAIDVTQAQFAQMSAKWKGTEAANRADMAFATLGDERMQQIGQAIHLIPAQRVGGGWRDPRTGLVYTDAEAKQISAKVDERDAASRTQVAGIGGQLAVEDAKAGHELAKTQTVKADEGARHIASQLQTAGVPQARAAADAALAALNKSPGGKGDVAARWMLGNGDAANAVMPDESNAREQAYWAFANASMKAMMGNVTESEMSRAQKQLGSASDPESRKRAIQATLAVLAEVEKNAKAGESPAAQAKFEADREAAKGDRPAAPPSAAKGW